MGRIWRSLIIGAVLMGCAACSGNDEPATGEADPTTTALATTSPTSVGGPLAAKGTATLTGAVSSSGVYEIQYSSTLTACEDLVSAASYVIPLPGRLDPLRLQWQAAVAALRGADTYDLTDLTTFKVTVIADPEAPAMDYAAVSGTTASLELSADGSGELVFEGLRAPTGDELHGTARWSCGPR
ncbi:MAG: hypothetical protein ACOYXM_06465 [Actinomycetota bacterium]